MSNIRQSFINQFNEYFDELCESPDTIYRKDVYIPYKNGTYEKDLATALLDISFNVTKANCDNLLPIPNPPEFNQQLRIQGISPIDGQSTMYAYIFWNMSLGFACIAFTGTVSLSEWKSDVQYEQVAPTQLNGYQDGILVHQGFYNIYLSIRNQLWSWWNQNSTCITTLFITGHSLGGALSTICSFDFADALSPIISMNKDIKCVVPKDEIYFPIHYSFAAPRSGNTGYVQVFNERIPTSIRVNNTEDIVPQLPPAAWINGPILKKLGLFWDGWIYEQTGGNIPFTVSLGSIANNHIQAYHDYLPECAQVAPCHIDNN